MLSVKEAEEKAVAKAQRQAVVRQVLATLPAEASGREIVAAMRRAAGSVPANQQAAQDRAKAKRVAQGKANLAKFEAKVAQRRAAKEAAKQARKQAKADEFAAVVAATVW